MKRSVALILCTACIVASCSWPLGETVQSVGFTVLESPGYDKTPTVPEVSIVNVGDETVDILITGEALNNGASPFVVRNIKANRGELQIVLDWDTSGDAFPRPVHQLIRLEKGDWWSADEQPAIRLLNGNGGLLQAVSTPQQVQDAVADHLPGLKGERTYLKFSFAEVASSDPKGLWDVTVVGSLQEADGNGMNVVAKITLLDRDLTVSSGKVTYYSPSNGTIVKTEELPLP